MKHGWKRCEIKTVTFIHVIPINDLHEHDEHFGCWCRPYCDDDNVIIHNAADGREQFETGERRPS
jgi:hypothetical protein